MVSENALLAKGLCYSSCAAGEAPAAEVEDISMATRTSENARCHLGCRHRKLTRAAAQRPNTPNTAVKAGAVPLSPLPKDPVQDRQVQDVETITDSSSTPRPSLPGVESKVRPGRAQTSKFVPSSSARKPNTQSQHGPRRLIR